MEKVYTENITRRIITEPFHGNLVKAIDIVTTTINGKTTEEKNVFITTQENVDATVGLAKISRFVPVPQMLGGHAYVDLISKDNYDALMRGEYAQSSINTVVEIYREDKYSSGNYIAVLFNWDKNIIADLDCNLIPLPIHASYGIAGITNGKYNLEKLREKLIANPCVLTPESELEFKPLPKCFSNSVANKYLEFTFIPPAEVYEVGITKVLDRIPYMIEHTFDLSDCKIKR